MAAGDLHRLLTPPKLRAACWERAHGRCEVDGLPLDPGRWDCHHRQLRTAGGPDCLCNVLALHPTCHTVAPLSVHQEPRRSTQRGLMVGRYDLEPFDVPALLVTVYGEDRWLLSCAGDYVWADA